jgi:hypothetical protein
LQSVDVAVGGAKDDGIAGDCGRRQHGAYGKHLVNAGNHVVVKKVEEGGLVFRGTVFFGVSCCVFLSAIGIEGPGEFLRFQIDGEKAALVRAVSTACSFSQSVRCDCR